MFSPGLPRGAPKTAPTARGAAWHRFADAWYRVVAGSGSSTARKRAWLVSFRRRGEYFLPPAAARNYGESIIGSVPPDCGLGWLFVRRPLRGQRFLPLHRVGLPLARSASPCRDKGPGLPGPRRVPWSGTRVAAHVCSLRRLGSGDADHEPTRRFRGFSTTWMWQGT